MFPPSVSPRATDALQPSRPIETGRGRGGTPLPVALSKLSTSRAKSGPLPISRPRSLAHTRTRSPSGLPSANTAPSSRIRGREPPPGFVRSSRASPACHQRTSPFFRRAAGPGAASYTSSGKPACRGVKTPPEVGSHRQSGASYRLHLRGPVETATRSKKRLDGVFPTGTSSISVDPSGRRAPTQKMRAPFAFWEVHLTPASTASSSLCPPSPIAFDPEVSSTRRQIMGGDLCVHLGAAKAMTPKAMAAAMTRIRGVSGAFRFRDATIRSP